jgi:hypothetical protein
MSYRQGGAQISGVPIYQPFVISLMQFCLFDGRIHFCPLYIYLYSTRSTWASPFLAYTGLAVRTANWSAAQRLLLQWTQSDCLTMFSVSIGQSGSGLT